MRWRRFCRNPHGCPPRSPSLRAPPQSDAQCRAAAQRDRDGFDRNPPQAALLGQPADGWQDHDCLGESGDTLQDWLFTECGINVVDEPRLRFHLALDELFGCC